jgi:GAF domain-containing protein
MRAFYALPLIDDQGRLGVLSFESSDPDFLTVAHLEIIKVLAGQATVALRNASLYREVPFINLLEPLLQRKKRFLALEKRRRWLMIAGAVAILAVPCYLSVAHACFWRRDRQLRREPRKSSWRRWCGEECAHPRR